MKEYLIGLSLMFVIPSCIYFWYYFIHLTKTKQIKLPEDNLFSKKSHFFILLFVFSFFLFPINTYAKTDVSPFWTGYKNRSNDWSRPHNISSSYDPALSDCNGLARWQGCPIPAADTNLRQFYAITTADVCFTNSVVANKVYNIELQWWGSYGNYSTDANWLVAFNEYSWSPNGAITHTGHEFTRNNDNHYRGVTTYTFVPNNNYNSWCISIGGGNYSDRVLWLNRADNSQSILLAYAYLDENTGSDGALLEQQIETNQKLSDINNTQQQTNNKIDETNDNLESIGDKLVDDTAPTNQDLEDFMDDLPAISFGPVSQLLQMPINILNKVNDGLNGSCSSISLPFFYNNNVNLPCFNGAKYFGSNLWQIIGYFCSFFIYYQCAMLIISAWESWTSFDDGFNSLYSPKHADSGYKPKHGGGN